MENALLQLAHGSRCKLFNWISLLSAHQFEWQIQDRLHHNYPMSIYQMNWPITNIAMSAPGGGLRKPRTQIVNLSNWHSATIHDSVQFIWIPAVAIASEWPIRYAYRQPMLAQPPQILGKLEKLIMKWERKSPRTSETNVVIQPAVR